ncbi:MAG: site-2 protease family protein [Myxococcales bacterium]|nr:site-2 protease family protein [Myxococcales bacterium]
MDNRSGRNHRYGLHLLLFLLTCATTFLAGAWSAGGPGLNAAAGGMFAAAIMSILLVHEMGHYLAARRHRVEASLPYFLPAPFPPVGTFGAVIRMREPPRSRSALLDIGMGGPLAGLLPALLVCLVGLHLSPVVEMSDLPQGAMLEGNSLLYLGLKRLAHPEMGPSQDVLLHPLAWAGWLGLLVTSLNLLPAGQLDGGHVAYALFGADTHRRLSRTVHVAVFVLGLLGLACELLLVFDDTAALARERGWLPWLSWGSGMLPWLVWTVLLRFVGGRHPAIAAADDPEPSPTRRRLGLATLALFVLTFTPSLWSPLP